MLFGEREPRAKAMREAVELMKDFRVIRYGLADFAVRPLLAANSRRPFVELCRTEYSTHSTQPYIPGIGVTESTSTYAPGILRCG